MSRNIKKIVCLMISVAIGALCLCGCGEKEEKNKSFKDKVDVTGKGLHISKSGWITLNGKPFYGFGFVFKDAFKMKLNDKNVDLEPYFQKLSEGNIPFVRVMMGPEDQDMLFKYKTAKNEYLEAMDSVVKLAEKYKVGIVATLFWNPGNIAEASGENIQKMFEVPESESYKFVQQYTTEIVSRYKDSKALWAWEISDGGNLLCEVTKYTKVYSDGSTYQQIMFTEVLVSFYNYVSKIIRDNDPYRMISTGDASPRFYSKALRENFYTAPWDSYEDTKETMSLYAAGETDCLSIQTPYISYLDWYTKVAEELSKGIYVSSFNGTLYKNPDDSILPENDIFEKNEQESFNAYVDAYKEYGIQMAAANCFASYAVNPQDDASVEVGTTAGITRNKYVWERLVAENSEIKTSGKVDFEGYWEE